MAAAPMLRRIGRRLPISAQREAEEGEHGDRHRDLAGQLAGGGEARDQRAQDHVDRQRDDADAEFHQLPPAFGPEAGLDRGGCSGAGVGASR